MTELRLACIADRLSVGEDGMPVALMHPDGAIHAGDEDEFGIRQRLTVRVRSSHTVLAEERLQCRNLVAIHLHVRGRIQVGIELRRRRAALHRFARIVARG
jgi:hypothetical protein